MNVHFYVQGDTAQEILDQATQMLGEFLGRKVLSTELDNSITVEETDPSGAPLKRWRAYVDWFGV